MERDRVLMAFAEGFWAAPVMWVVSVDTYWLAAAWVDRWLEVCRWPEYEACLAN